MTKAIIQAPGAPKAIGPYSTGVRVADLLFCSGQIAMDPATGDLIEGDAVAQTHQIMRNLSAVLEAAGAKFDNVVKTTLFLVDLNDFPRINEAYGKYFPSGPPARSTIQVSALPKGARVEIEAIAHLGA